MKLYSLLNRKRFNPKYLVLPFVLTGFVYGGNSASAESNVDVIYSNESITLQFNQNADFYELYKEGKLVYKGSDKNFVDKNIKEGQRYKIGVYNNNKLEDVINVRTNKNEDIVQTKSPQMRSVASSEQDSQDLLMKEEVNNSYVESVTSANSVSLEWSALPDNDGIYEIFRDSKKIGETKELQFVDTNVEPDKRYTYDIVAESEVDESTKEKINEEIKKQNSTPDAAQLHELYNTKGMLTKLVDTPSIDKNSLTEKTPVFEGEESSTIGTRAIPKSEEYSFRYTTFIPQKSVIDFLSPGNWLKGDNRGYDPYSTKFRTNTEVNVGFWMPFMTPFLETGKSHRCDTSACTKVIKEDQASTSGIKVTKDIVTTSKMRWRVNHDVGIPFGAIYPNITYYYDAVLTKTTFNVNGSHDKAPAHEFYMFSATSSGYNTLHRTTVDSTWDFTLLAPGAPQTNFKVSL
ncbi:DUF3238 domain-containing protein [Peribacillus aracenensis]|uniref:DUF3238 domain-containing protein n=1 Tax=Peribacillus aracenensis TaxID=2976708 RepID=UPI0021A5AD23|nr:DUF3238 domain-containing protein [Peribacillus sp. BBB004]